MVISMPRPARRPISSRLRCSTLYGAAAHGADAEKAYWIGLKFVGFIVAEVLLYVDLGLPRPKGREK